MPRRRGRPPGSRNPPKTVPPTLEPLVVKVNPACALLGSISRTRLYELIDAGVLEKVKLVGAKGGTLITMHSIHAAIARGIELAKGE
jgi:hypothetical protein